MKALALNSSMKPFWLKRAKTTLNFLVLSCFAVNLTMAADLIVSPNDRATQAGNDALNVGFTAPGSFQQLYGSGQFTGPVIITGLAFRPQGDSVGSSFAVVIPRLTIDLSTYSKSLNLFSTSYNANKGSDTITVFDGSVNWQSTDLPGSVPNPFDFNIALAAPFIYDPAKGSLLMQFVSDGEGNIGADAHFHGDSTIGLLASHGGIFSGSIITQFSVIPVPEPSAFRFLMLGLVLAPLMRRKR
jgi:hypothetical protein